MTLSSFNSIENYHSFNRCILLWASKPFRPLLFLTHLLQLLLNDGFQVSSTV
uniref:Uncharacterized protein n=1 Tax=Solanum tuberosum TaxID=4113 RepID=M1AXQ6_SOLTU